MDWQPGDLALCVRGGYIAGPNTSAHPISGRIYTVERVGSYKFALGRKLALWLVDGPPNNSGVSRWPAYRFRKINPHTPDEQDEITIRLLTPVEA